ncbi:MAG: ATP-binding protein [Cyanobacteria bacterium]|nr:ATP-binding protein [Cyanobacteriota bacterium]
MKLSSLFRKTLLGQALLFGLVVGSLSATSAYSLRWYLAGEYVSRGSAIARGVAGVSQQSLENQSLESLPQLLAGFKDLQGVAYLFVASPEGELLVHRIDGEIPTSFQRPNFNPRQRAAAPDSQYRLNRFTHSPNFENDYGQVSVEYMTIDQVGYVINLSFPIQGGDLGYVYVGMDQVRMIQQIRTAASIQLWVMLGLFTLSVIVTYVMVQRISRPLNRLTEYARNLSNRNFAAPLAIHSQDEIGLLASTMQTMATDIQQFIQQLETALDELRSTQTQLIQSEKMSSLGQLVAGVAHEINNPVSFIACNINYAENYAKILMALIEPHQHPGETLSPELQGEAIDLDFVIQDFPKVLGSMRLGAERIRAIVQSLRNFSRLDESDIKAVDIHEGIDSTLMILNSRLKGDRHSSPIQVIRAYGDLPPVECYAGQLNQVFMNILSNAIDALEGVILPKGEMPTITITTTCDPQQVCIDIQDNGGGIPLGMQGRLFDPFFTTKPVGKGTGLGLSISYQIVVERHQGQLSCESMPGRGTQFRIAVPLRQRATVAHPSATVLPQVVA